MDTELIIFNEYCQKSHTDPTFIISLEEGGLIEIRTVDGERYLRHSSYAGTHGKAATGSELPPPSAPPLPDKG